MELLIDGRRVPVRGGDTVLAAARGSGIYLPALCSHPVLTGAEDCGLCLVEVKGIDGPVRACQIRVSEGLQVRTDTPAVRLARREMLKVVLAAHPRACLACVRRPGHSPSQCSGGVPLEELCCELKRVMDFIGLPAGNCAFGKFEVLLPAKPLTANLGCLDKGGCRVIGAGETPAAATAGARTHRP